MEQLTETAVRQLAGTRGTRCVSLLTPVRGGEAAEDLLRWKNLTADAESQLVRVGETEAAAAELVRPARAVLLDKDFWSNLPGGGLALFLAPQRARIFHLPGPVPATAVVASRFRLTPLLTFGGLEDGYFLLAISQKRVRLFRGTATAAEEVAVAGLPESLAEVLGRHDRDEPLEYHTHPALGYGRRSAVYHGQGVGIDDAKSDLLQYCRAVDKGLHPVLRDERVPMVLAGVCYLWPIYRKANTYPGLLEQGVAGNPDRLSAAQMHAKALPEVKPLFDAPQQQAAALFAQIVGTGRTASDLAEVVTASERGLVEILFVATDAERQGRVVDSGEVIAGCEPQPGDEDLLNRAAADTLAHGGTVFTVPTNAVPGKGAIAAIYWLPHAGKKKFASPRRSPAGRAK
jgi:hypothetical protein